MESESLCKKQEGLKSKRDRQNIVWKLIELNTLNVTALVPEGGRKFAFD